MPFHRKAGPKRTELEHAQVFGEYSVRIVTTTGIQARFQDAAARLGLDNGRQECGRLLGRLVAWFVYQPPRRQAEILGVLPDPVELPLGPGVGED